MPWESDAARFERVMQFVRDHFNVMPLPVAIEALRRGTLPAAAACITFDDGYADNFTVATPILQRLGLVATFFISTGYLDGGRMWNDTVIEALRGAPARLDLSSLGLGDYELHDLAARITAIDSVLSKLKYHPVDERDGVSAEIARQAGLGDDLGQMMSTQQVAGLVDAGMDVGGHTVRHPILAALENDAAFDEILEGKRRLEAITQRSIHAFAYPNGVPGKDYTERDVQLVRKAGFECAVTTSWGVATAKSDYYQLPRFTPWDRSASRFGLRMMQNLGRRASELPRTGPIATA
jgi:peptidoglycan/xylan/chitin deacetylase (PgdA/CDA1 family)